MAISPTRGEKHKSFYHELREFSLFVLSGEVITRGSVNEYHRLKLSSPRRDLPTIDAQCHLLSERRTRALGILRLTLCEDPKGRHAVPLRLAPPFPISNQKPVSFFPSERRVQRRGDTQFDKPIDWVLTQY